MARSTSAEGAPKAGYETTFVTRSELTDEQLKAIQEKLNGVVSQYKGELVLTEDWGKRKLAYPIRKEQRAQYTYMVYTGEGEIVHEIERNLRLNEHVLRFLSVNLNDEFDAEDFRKKRTEYHAAVKRREEEREARREERMAERRGYGDYDRGDRDRDRGHDRDRDRGERPIRNEEAAAPADEE